MKLFYDMLRRTTSSPYHDQMMKFVSPLKDHFGINHFWYFRVTHTGHYCFAGTHSAWNEYCFENNMVGHFSCLRHPDTMQQGISLMKKSDDPDYLHVLKTAWEKFSINFSINLLKKVSEGMVGIGFAAQTNHPATDERLLNLLPLLNHFTNLFLKTQDKYIHILHENQVDISSYLGSLFFKESEPLKLPLERDLFLRKIGFDAVFLLSPRERDVLKFLANGYPAGYIAGQLQLSERTVENYLATIKCKLYCTSKVELIQIAHQLSMLGYFEGLNNF